MRFLALLFLAAPLSAQTIDLSRGRLVDLTHALDENTLFWPTSPTRFKLDRLSYGETPAAGSTRRTRSPCPNTGEPILTLRSTFIAAA
jgi:hypothetical protein